LVLKRIKNPYQPGAVPVIHQPAKQAGYGYLLKNLGLAFVIPTQTVLWSTKAQHENSHTTI
jgi:hypothetical protein